VVTGADPVAQKRFGDFLDHDARYERTGEFLEVLRGVALPAGSEKRFDFTGTHYRVEGAQIDFGDYALPQVFFGGASPAAHEVAARHADTYLVWGENPEFEGERIKAVREKAEALGRKLSFGIRLHVISRDSEAQAWAETDALLEKLSPERIAHAQTIPARTQSVGQSRMNALHSDKRDQITFLSSARSGNLSQSLGRIWPCAGWCGNGHCRQS
jgi:alkanesulfonate monooxygenase